MSRLQGVGAANGAETARAGRPPPGSCAQGRCPDNNGSATVCMVPDCVDVTEV